MKQNYNNKKKHRSAWLALVLLMITALPISAQNAGDKFQVGQLYYEVIDAAAKTVKVTYANTDATKPEARQQELKDETTNIPDQWKGYNGTLKTNAVDKNGKKVETMEDELAYELATGQIYTITIPDKVNHNGKDWTVTAIGSNAFINERRIRKMVLPETIEAIEDAAFYQCSVTLLNFPKGLKYIGWGAFYKSNLAPFYLKEYKGRNPAKKGTWERKTDKTSVDIPGSTAIGPQAFEGIFSTSKFNCPNITFVGYQAFKGAKIDITTPIPATAKIGEQPEDNKIKAMYKNLPAGTDQRSGVESFAEFGGSVSLAEGPTTIPTGMFENAFTNLDKFVIPYSVKNSIEERAFENAGILSFNDLSVVTKIGARAFKHGCISGDFVILDNVTEIGDEAFACNGKLTGFTVKGSNDCKIGEGIVRGCYNLEYLDLRNMNSTEAKKNLKNLSREFDTATNPNKTITAGLPTHTVVYLPDAQGITIADGQDVNFVKGDGTCTKLSLQDGMEYEFPYAIKANQAVYNRCNMTVDTINIERGYNTTLKVAHYEGDKSLTSYRDFSKFADGKHCFTIFLPYAVTLPTGIRAYELKYKNKKEYFTDGYEDPDNGHPNGYPSGETEFYVFNSIPDGSTLEANRPYLLRITNANSDNSNSKAFTAKNVEIAKSPEKFAIVDGGCLKPVGFPVTSSEQSYSFQGSTEKIDSKAYGENRPYVLNIMEMNTIDGKKVIDVWRQMKYENKGSNIQNPSIPPFRGFVSPLPGTSGAKRFMVLSEGETTGINDVTGNTDVQQGVQRIYTIDGRYVGTNFDSLPSGMYIMKGKKTLKTK